MRGPVSFRRLSTDLIGHSIVIQQVEQRLRSLGGLPLFAQVVNWNIVMLMSWLYRVQILGAD